MYVQKETGKIFSERPTRRNLGFVLVTLALGFFGSGVGPDRVAAQQTGDDQTGADDGADAHPNAAAGAPGQGAANPAFVPGDVLLSFRPGVAAAGARAVRRGLGASEKMVFSRLGVHHWQLPAGLTVPNAVKALSANPNVQYAEPNYVVYADAVIPDDPQFGELWGLDNLGQTGGTPAADIAASQAWVVTTGSASTVVGVIDSGVDYTHVDLAANMWTNPGEIAGNGLDDDGNGFVDDVHGYDFVNDDGDPFDDNRHGTHVSGTIGAVGNNGVGVVGVNWNIQIMALKSLGAGGSGSTADAIAAVDYATMMRTQFGVNIVLTSNSWGGGANSQALKDAIEASGTAGLLFIAAAGNSNADNDANPHYPSSYDLDNIISVAATDDNDDKASFSSFGTTSVDLGAPGVAILSTTPGDTYSTLNGTSMATPHVSGVAALAWTLSPAASYQMVRDAIFAGVDPKASMAGITVTGGRLDAYLTLQQLGMVVSGSSPADGGFVGTPPTEFVVDFSFPVDGATLDAIDLTVEGISANSVILDDADTATFTYVVSPVTDEGLQTMHMTSGAVATTSSEPLNPLVKEWNAAFRYDVVRMDVVSTVPADGSIVTLPLFDTLTVTFDEAFDDTTAGIDDLILSQGSVVSVDTTGNPTATYKLTGLASEGTLTVEMQAGALTDLFGNPMLAYSGSFELDFGTIPFPTPLEATAPPGSLIYEEAISGFVGEVGDTDTFEITVDPGQAITAVVDPDATLKPTVVLTGPLGAMDSASAPGIEAVIQTVGPTVGGMYAVTVSGDLVTTGAYTLQVILNAAVEDEAHDGLSNDDKESAQDINANFITLAGTADRGAVLGAITPMFDLLVVEDFDSGLGAYSQKGPSNTSVTGPAAHDSLLGLQDETNSGLKGWIIRDDAQVHAQQGDVISVWVRSVGAPAGRAYFGFGATGSGALSMVMAPNTGQLLIQRHKNYGYEDLGAVSQFWLADRWYRMEVTWKTGGEIVGRLYDEDEVTLLNTVTASDTTVSSGGIAFRAFGSTKYFDTVEVGPLEPDRDVYELNLGADESVTLALTGSGSNADLELLNSSGTSLMMGVTGSSNVDQVIDNFVATEGVYYATVSGDTSVEYSLTFTRGAAFDLEGNDDSASAQELDGREAVLGAITLSVTPLSEYVETFDDGDLDEYATPTGDSDPSNTSVTATAAHDGPFGLQDETNPGLGWIYRDDAGEPLVQQGDLVSVWVRSEVESTGRAYFGFGATDTGTLSMVMAPNSSSLSIQRNAAYGFQTLGSVTQSWLPDHWYRMEVDWETNGDITGRVYDSDGTTLLNTVAAEDTTISSGGIAFRAFGSTKHFDSVQLGGPNSDFYRITLAEDDIVNLETLTPAGGTGEFVNDLDPMIGLYDSSGNLLLLDDNSAADGRNANLSFTALASGIYYVEVIASGLTVEPTTGEYVLTIDVTAPPAAPGITVAPISGLVTTEAGGTATLTIVLTTEPIADVTIDLSSSDTTEGNVSPATLIFDAMTPWNVPQTVTVTGADDSVDDGDIAYTIITAAAMSSDPDYTGLNAADVSVTNLDDEGPSGPTSVLVDNITYATSGGKSGDKHLQVTIALVDDLGDPVAGASVSAELKLGGNTVASFTGPTGTDGAVTFQHKNAPGGEYTTEVTAVSASGLTWDGVTPVNSFTK